jgi:hypothetical protein
VHRRPPLQRDREIEKERERERERERKREREKAAIRTLPINEKSSLI